MEQIITIEELNPTQKLILLYLFLKGESKQSDIYTQLNIVNKTARINLEDLANKGYVRRGVRYNDWKINRIL